jgi:hypothetical protein
MDSGIQLVDFTCDFAKGDSDFANAGDSLVLFPSLLILFILRICFQA